MRNRQKVRENRVAKLMKEAGLKTQISYQNPRVKAGNPAVRPTII